MGLQECKRKHTSSEFVGWCVYFEQEVNDFHREDYYWANIACILAQVFKSDGSPTPTIDDFILKFKMARGEAEKKKGPDLKAGLLSALGAAGGQAKQEPEHARGTNRRARTSSS